MFLNLQVVLDIFNKTKQDFKLVLKLQPSCRFAMVENLIS